jgi:hypothetical protein
LAIEVLPLGGTSGDREFRSPHGRLRHRGDSTYLLVTGFTVAGVAAAVGWVIFLLRTFRRRKAKSETPLGALNVN